VISNDCGAFNDCGGDCGAFNDGGGDCGAFLEKEREKGKKSF
jgi:hypothetical protein